MSEATKLITRPMKAVSAGLMYLLKKRLLNSHSGASFDNESDYSSYLNSRNTGLLLDGDQLRLSEKQSFQNVCVTARIGAGKTSRYIIPNVLDRARRRCSQVINDPKGEVFSATSRYMKQCGYKVILIDPENLDRSSYFNPFLEAKNDIELEQVAEILVRCGNPTSSGKDDFWIQGAVRFVSLFIKCLKNAGEENPDHFNLHNLYYLFQNFGGDGLALDDFMARYSIIPDNPSDQSLWNEWKGVLTGNKEGVLSFVLNAITSLKSLSNQNIAKLTAKSDINLEDIRHEKTIIYLVTPAQHSEYYSFLTSLFFRSVFNACMRSMPQKGTYPVFILYDEFGHSTIPNFVSTANTIRGYEVSISIILQSISQLNSRYGHDYAKSIQGGFNTYLTYAGADPETANFFENIMGRVRERQTKEFFDTTNEYREYNLMNAGEIRMLDSESVLVVSGNKQAIQIPATPYFENWKFKRQTKKGALHMESHGNNEHLQYVSLT